MAPPVEFLQRAFLPVVKRMGASAEIDLARPGFAPAGGGMLQITILPCGGLQPLEILERGEEIPRSVECVLAHVNDSVARREIGGCANRAGRRGRWTLSRDDRRAAIS